MTHRLIVDVNTGIVTEVPLSQEEDAARESSAQQDSIRAQIEALQAQFTTTMQMRVSTGDQAAIATVTSLISQIDALKAQLQ